MIGIDDIDGLLAEAPAIPERGALDVLLDLGNDDPAASEIDESDFHALEEEWDLLVRLKARSDKLADLADKAKIDYNLQRDRMKRAMEAQGTRQFSSSEGRGAGSLAREYRTSIEDPEAFMGWVNANHPELLTVNSQTRDSFVRNQFRDKGVAPDDPSFPPGIRVIEQEVLRVRNVRPVQTQQEQQE